MGRKTWDSVPEKYRPFKDRINLILSSSMQSCPEGVDGVFSSLEEAVKALSSAPLSDRVDEVWVLGGSGVYKDSLQSPNFYRLYLTRIQQEFECDTFFPKFDENSFTIVSDSRVPADMQEEKGIEYKFFIYERKT